MSICGTAISGTRPSHFDCLCSQWPPARRPIPFSAQIQSRQKPVPWQHPHKVRTLYIYFTPFPPKEYVRNWRFFPFWSHDERKCSSKWMPRIFPLGFMLAWGTEISLVLFCFVFYQYQTTNRIFFLFIHVFGSADLIFRNTSKWPKLSNLSYLLSQNHKWLIPTNIHSSKKWGIKIHFFTFFFFKA